MNAGRNARRRRRMAVGLVLVVGLAMTWLPAAGQDWAPFLEQLREQPDREALTGLVINVLGRFEQDLSVLDPSRTILECAGGGCLRPVLLTPPSQLVAGQTRSGPSRSYNDGRIVGLIGGFDGTIARDVEGFFLLRSNPDGSISLLDTAGEEAERLAAAHVDQVSVTPIPIPDPEGDSVLLPSRVLDTRIEIEEPAAHIAGRSRTGTLFSIGSTGETGLFSGIVFSGQIPES